MEISFPVFVYAKDCDEIRRYDSIDELQRQLEEIDVENNEYLAWDRFGAPLKLGVQKPMWITVEAAAPDDGASLKDCLGKYARSLGLNPTEIGSSADELAASFQQITNEAEKRRRDQGFFRRMFTKT